ncbi:hypothetical protein cyc_07217 [Cyclospora cayetanensis]|uniref:Uncharacterized protein n=1 Tax=Cyclospora cayetanensis TaxID=88456 RepID=A0A1D3CRA0_9EIME|nr:hypothetical protein cyc_07217 [Cyclospora cayetanensis]
MKRRLDSGTPRYCVWSVSTVLTAREALQRLDREMRSDLCVFQKKVQTAERQRQQLHRTLHRHQQKLDRLLLEEEAAVQQKTAAAAELEAALVASGAKVPQNAFAETLACLSPAAAAGEGLPRTAAAAAAAALLPPAEVSLAKAAERETVAASGLSAESAEDTDGTKADCARAVTRRRGEVEGEGGSVAAAQASAAVATESGETVLDPASLGRRRHHGIRAVLTAVRWSSRSASAKQKSRRHSCMAQTTTTTTPSRQAQSCRQREACRGGQEAHAGNSLPAECREKQNGDEDGMENASSKELHRSEAIAAEANRGRSSICNSASSSCRGKALLPNSRPWEAREQSEDVGDNFKSHSRFGGAYARNLTGPLLKKVAASERLSSRTRAAVLQQREVCYAMAVDIRELTEAKNRMQLSMSTFIECQEDKRRGLARNLLQQALWLGVLPCAASAVAPKPLQQLLATEPRSHFLGK